MAFVSSPLPQEEQNQLSQQGQTTPNPMALLPPQAAQSGGSAGQGGGAASGGTAPSVGSPTQFGSSASRLGDYLSANQDQVQGMADKIAGNLGSQYSNLNSSIGQAGQTFGQQVQQGYTPQDPSLLSQVQSNPTGVASDPNKVSSFQKQLNDSYTGPSSFEGSTPYSSVQRNVNDAMQQANLLGTYPGLSTYLQNNVESNPTPGQNTLDTALLQANQPAFQTVQQAAKPFSGLGDYLSQTAQTANQGVQSAQAAAPAAAQAAKQAWQGAANPLVQSLNTGYSTASKGATDYNTQLNDIASKIEGGNYGALSKDEQSLIGYNPGITSLIQQYPTIFPSQAQNSPINFSQYFKQGDQAQMPTPGSSVTPDQLAEWNALTTLSGNAPTGLNFAMPTELSPMAGQTGGQPGNLPQYNNQQALAAIEQAYGPLFNEAVQGGITLSPEQSGFMQSERTLAAGGQPSPQPTTPPPAPGTAGDLGAGFHWDTTSGAWMPNIPLQPGGTTGGTTTTSGGGHAFF